jgi:phosphoribosylformimino-5-aminoimidazole carboxamide ribotide isomerase
LEKNIGMKLMIIPVIDLKNGEAVSGKSGKRETYTSLETVFDKSSEPIAIARELKKYGFSRIYIADLDAIEGTNSNLQIAGEINKIIPVMFDYGIKNSIGIQNILDRVEKVIIATETIENFDEIDLIFSSFPKDNLVLSIDIKDGNVLGKYITTDFKNIIKKIEEINPIEVILLDISRVGTENGVDHELIKSFIGLDTDIILGGGITLKDITDLQSLGIEYFLVGTALHSGYLNSLF